MPLRRSFVSVGIALLGAGAIAVAPVAAPPAQVRAAGIDVTLTAAATVESCAPTATALCEPADGAHSPAQTAEVRAEAAPSIFNIPANLFIALANVPYNFFNALGQGDVNLGDRSDSGFAFVNSRDGVDLNQTEVVGLTADLEYGGSWWVYHPFNVLGTDAADIARYQSLVNVLLPFPALSVGLGNILATVAASQLPMDVGCTGLNTGGCDRPGQLLSKMFNLGHIVELFSPGGYTFPEVENPITCTTDGLCDIKDPDGETESWSKQNSRLDIGAPFQNFFESLTETPDFSRIKLPSLTMIVNTITGFIRGLNTAFNPFVLGTQCGLCSALIPVPPGATRPGPTNPGTEIPGMPGTEEPTTEPTIEPTIERSAETKAPSRDEDVATSVADKAKSSTGEPEISGDTEATSPPTDDVRRGHVDDSGDVASEDPGDDDAGRAPVPAKPRPGDGTKSGDPKPGDAKPHRKNADGKPDSDKRHVREREAA
ncbi:hypothetical protein C6A87_021880 [Mycobacterium sp. ITM-2016-00317]|uniref:hypothetical protein n=1 Tax=Mycobacterium sp. ITM-2016-00317 TaxID=2099694 RepID=UPI00287F8CB9|nr:hypothetical protein [Mycobacterium sp. ITM-2016-00317]WNG86465.1 hypothetical protein C6A87_021880 [Mycobacterium sp. ITM-2016-00317]